MLESSFGGNQGGGQSGNPCAGDRAAPLAEVAESETGPEGEVVPAAVGEAADGEADMLPLEDEQPVAAEIEEGGHE